MDEPPRPDPPTRVLYAGQTDVGRQRKHNEDCVLIKADQGLFVVADGMGGHNAGDVASKLVTTSLANFFEATGHGAPLIELPPDYDKYSPGARRLVAGVAKANRDVFTISNTHQQHHGMGSTCVAMHLAEGMMHIAHVGDSRCYRLRGGEMKQMTRDHSLINDALDMKPDLTREELARLPKNIITRALGMKDVVKVDIKSEPVLPGDTFMLCSDGLTGMVPVDEIVKILNFSFELQEVCDLLIAEANDRGGTDNISALVVRVDSALGDAAHDGLEVHAVVDEHEIESIHDENEDSDDEVTALRPMPVRAAPLSVPDAEPPPALAEPIPERMRATTVKIGRGQIPAPPPTLPTGTGPLASPPAAAPLPKIPPLPAPPAAPTFGAPKPAPTFGAPPPMGPQAAPNPRPAEPAFIPAPAIPWPTFGAPPPAAPTFGAPPPAAAPTFGAPPVQALRSEKPRPISDQPPPVVRVPTPPPPRPALSAQSDVEVSLDVAPISYPPDDLEEAPLPLVTPRPSAPPLDDSSPEVEVGPSEPFLDPALEEFLTAEAAQALLNGGEIEIDVRGPWPGKAHVRRCQRCKHELFPGNRFCVECGTRIEASHA